MRILVTGGAGFIASHVVDQYLKLGHQVAVLDNLCTGRRENLNPEATFYEVDLTDAGAVEEVVQAERPQLINHHAAQMEVRRSVREPLFDAQTNIVGSLHLLQSALRAGTEKIIYASTGGAIYGELEYIPADENHPVNPLCPYGVSKHTVEHYLYLYHHREGLSYTILRYANVYGPRQNPWGEAGVVAIFGHQMLSGQTPTIFGDGTDTRDYVFVADVVGANVLAVDSGDNDVFNIGTSQQTSVGEILEAIARAVGYRGACEYASARPGDLRRSALDCTKAQRVWGWAPQYSLEAGIARTIEYLHGAAASAN